MMPADLEKPDVRLIDLFEPLPVLIARLTPDGPPPDGPQLGFAGVGKPWKVERSLIAAGCDLVDFAPYPDHTPYRAADLGFLAGPRRRPERRPDHHGKGLGAPFA